MGESEIEGDWRLRSPRHTIEQISDIVQEYETRPNRPIGHIVTRFVADMEPDVLNEIAHQTGLSQEELLLYIENEEFNARRIDVVDVSSKSKLAIREEQKRRLIDDEDPDNYENRQNEINHE